MAAFYKDIQKRKSPYIAAEIGANHNGDMGLAKEMIDAAKACGCDAVKFQSWTPQSLICKEEYEKNQKYNDSPKKHFGSLKEMVEKYYLRDEQHAELKAYCDKKGITFFSTPFSNDEVDLLDRLGVGFYKIASMDVNNLDLLSYMAAKRKPMVLSTGMASLAEIRQAVKTIEATGNKEIVLLHCVALYPPSDKDVNLNNILMLRDEFNYPVGFSDHTFGASISLAAVALGACFIEKHFTLDKTLPGWDHEISADPAEMKAIVDESRRIAVALGARERTVSQLEEEKKKKFRRSLVLSKALRRGDTISEADLTSKRPGTGIPPDRKHEVLGKKLKRDKSYDEILLWDDIQ